MTDEIRVDVRLLPGDVLRRFGGRLRAVDGDLGFGVDLQDPRDTYADPAQWDEKAKDLAARFQKNFAKFTGNEAGKALVAAGPQL